jgi:hypothetical protein
MHRTRLHNGAVHVQLGPLVLLPRRRGIAGSLRGEMVGKNRPGLVPPVPSFITSSGGDTHPR